MQHTYLHTLIAEFAESQKKLKVNLLTLTVSSILNRVLYSSTLSSKDSEVFGSPVVVIFYATFLLVLRSEERRVGKECRL